MIAPLSPAAQAILQRANNAAEALPLHASPVMFSLAMIAAAIEALADQVAPEADPPQRDDATRRKILAIAAELRGAP